MYKNLLFFLIISIFVSSCSKDEELITDYEQSVINYFLEVGLGGHETTHTHKWVEPMRIFINNDANDDISVDLIGQTIDEINIIATDGFLIEIVNDSINSNTYIFLGTIGKFDNLFPDLSGGSNYGWAEWWEDPPIIYKAVIFLNPFNIRNSKYKNSVIKEELMHSLGFFNHSDKYPESVLRTNAASRVFTEEFAQIDKDLIRLLYHPSMRPGLDATQAEEVLKNILSTE